MKIVKVDYMITCLDVFEEKQSYVVDDLDTAIKLFNQVHSYKLYKCTEITKPEENSLDLSSRIKEQKRKDNHRS